MNNDMTIAQEEIFGPVLSVIAYDYDDEVIRISNDSKYGLHAAVLETDLQRALSALDARPHTKRLVDELLASYGVDS